jgi:hypothetical protein
MAACGLGLLALIILGFVSLYKVQVHQQKVSELLELKQRADNFSVASDSLLLFGANKPLWQAYEREGRSIQQQLQTLASEHPELAKAAHYIDIMMASLDAAELDDPGRVYAVHRENWMMGRPVRVGGWGGDWLARLYHRRRAGFTNAAVHESLATDGLRVERLDGLLIHRAVEDLGDFLDKVRRYSALRAPAKRPVHPALIVPRAAWAFLRSYLFQVGFLAGWRGLAIAWSNANGVFYKYLRAWARHRRGMETRRERD